MSLINLLEMPEVHFIQRPDGKTSLYAVPEENWPIAPTFLESVDTAKDWSGTIPASTVHTTTWRAAAERARAEGYRKLYFVRADREQTLVRCDIAEILRVIAAGPTPRPPYVN